MKSTNREKNTATLSIVRSITNSCLLKLGINRTSFNIRNSRNVRSTDRPELPARSFSFPILCASSNALTKYKTDIDIYSVIYLGDGLRLRYILGKTLEIVSQII